MTHVVTGATGFVGSAIVLELLEKDDEPIVAIVRASPDGPTPTERLRSILSGLVDGYDLSSELRHEIDRRVSAVRGDLEEPLCGAAELQATNPVFWHCAASLQYQDRHRGVIERSNIGGTRNALDLAERLGARRFNSISTAYVAGRRSGLILADVPDPTTTNNLYERSKVEAERLVTQSELPSRIMRPGVVIGHSETAHTTSTDGFYGFLRSLIKFRRVLERTQPGLAERLDVQVRADSGGHIGFSPVDHVARDAVALHGNGAPDGIYHLTNPTPPRLQDALDVSFELAGLQAPTLVADTNGFSETDETFHKRIDFYSSYVINPKRFDRSATDAAAGVDGAPPFAMDRDELRRFGTAYIDLHESGRTSLPSAR